MDTQVDLQIKKVNETYIKVLCKDKSTELDIKDHFAFQIPNPQFDPRVKKGHWDGIKKLFNLQKKTLYTGLLFDLLRFCKERNWTYSIDPSIVLPSSQVDLDDLKSVCEEIIKPVDENNQILTPYDDQYTALEYMMNMHRTTCLAATSAGKSLILYLACRMYQLMEEFDGKTILIIVPTTTLVEQLYSDFGVYSSQSDWNVHQQCQKISGSYTKSITKQIVISTWQSAMNFDFSFYDDLGGIFVDECHTAKANEITKILENAIYTPIRHGLTGTLDNVECNEMVIRGLLGPVKRIVTAKQLIDKGRATKVIIRMIILKHSKDTVEQFLSTIDKKKGVALYNHEVQFLNGLERRRDVLKKMITSVDGNNVILFDRVETYGEQLYQDIVDTNPSDTFLFIGDTKKDERESIRLSMNDHDNANIFASFQTFQMGVSIKKLHNAFLISSSKSVVRILQSLGRLMRLHASKDVAYIYDIVDDLSSGKSNNAVFRHAFERIEMYRKEGHPVEFITLEL